MVKGESVLGIAHKGYSILGTVHKEEPVLDDVHDGKVILGKGGIEHSVGGGDHGGRGSKRRKMRERQLGHSN